MYADFQSLGQASLDAPKKSPQEILFSFPALNTRLRLWFYMLVYACVYLTSVTHFFFIIKVVKFSYDLFFTVKEAASEKC